LSFVDQLLHNPILAPALTAWLSAQLLKVLLTLILRRKLNLVLLVEAGGMPSAHSATMTSVAVTTGLAAGFDSLLFGVTAMLALVVMYDAVGVRRAAGIQARLLNEIIENFFSEHYINRKKLKELIGHTPVEVFAGALLGIIISLAFYFI
jgi:acid phosphatase family membrane protein YuiD